MTVKGVVVRSDRGTPVVSAEVKVSQPGSAFLTAHLETDGDGRFFADGLPDGDYTLTILKPGYIETTLPLPKDDGPLSVRLVRTAVITGRVILSDNSPVPRARVYLVERSRSGGHRELVPGESIKADGSYRLRDIRPGSYLVGVTYEASPGVSGGTFYPDNRQPRVFAVRGGEEFRDVDFLAESGNRYRVAGKVILPPAQPPAEVPGDSGAAPAKPREPVYSVGLAASSAPGVLVAWTRTKEGGAFEFPGVPWGSYELFVAGPSNGYSAYENVLDKGESFFARRNISVSADTVDIELSPEPGRRAKLMLTAGPGGREGCLASVSVRLRAKEAWGVYLTRDVELSLDSPLELENLAPTAYEVLPAKPAEGCTIAGGTLIDLHGGNLTEPVSLTAATVGTIKGQVLSPAPGIPLEVLLLPMTRDLPGPMRLEAVDGQGRFQFEELRPGPYVLSVRPMGTAGDRAGAAEEGTEVELRGGTVHVMLHPPESPGEGRRQP